MSKRRTLQELTPDPVELRRCNECAGSFSEAHYSMALNDARSHFRASRAKLVCNVCLTNRGTGFFRESTTWQTEKACKPRDAHLFFPKDSEEVKERAWRWICASCPVLTQCFKFGAQTAATGVYGGVYLEDGIESRRIEDLDLRRTRIIELYTQGFSGKAISRSLGIGMNTVFRELDREGIPRRPRK